MSEEESHYGRFSDVRTFDAEGARVGIVTCLLCGAAILIDPADGFDPKKIHAEFHSNA